MTLRSPAFEVIGELGNEAPFVFTCEHASNRVPHYLEASETDAALLKEHWGWDIGAENVVRELVASLGGQGVLGGFTRLVIDLNRDPDGGELFLLDAHGIEIGFNRGLDEREKQVRRDEIFSPYHRAVDDVITARQKASSAPMVLVSVHSFVPIFRGEARAIEVGVLFDEYEEMAIELARDIGKGGIASALNEPYSGKPPSGLIYSAASHGSSQRVPYVELEIRQDLIETEASAKQFAARLTGPLRELARTL